MKKLSWFNKVIYFFQYNFGYIDISCLCFTIFGTQIFPVIIGTHIDFAFVFNNQFTVFSILVISV